MKKVLYILYQPYKWLIFIPFLAINTAMFAILAILLAIISNQKIASWVGGVLWARLNSFLTPIWVRVKGRKNLKKGQSYVFVANHLSSYDIFVLYGWLGVDFRWTMKRELRKVPGLGFASEKVGHIFLDRSNTKAAVDSIKAAREKIKGGTSIVVFPEGTRNITGETGRFKKGAFMLAIDLKLPIVPLSIKGTDKILPADTFDLFPGKASITIHPPVSTDAYDATNVDELITICREVVVSGLTTK
ncbi:MAG: 1-acyl-sn-glycerol-3-phosphate acyltransferase [Cyclobacteriaceae bacterium]|nr:1-acyl-sn-glycerol-3-phosphate acyltransferase [Cyclobacteriaceae bacterium]